MEEEEEANDNDAVMAARVEMVTTFEEDEGIAQTAVMALEAAAASAAARMFLILFEFRLGFAALPPLALFDADLGFEEVPIPLRVFAVATVSDVVVVTVVVDADVIVESGFVTKSSTGGLRVASPPFAVFSFAALFGPLTALV